MGPLFLSLNGRILVFGSRDICGFGSPLESDQYSDGHLNRTRHDTTEVRFQSRIQSNHPV